MQVDSHTRLFGVIGDPVSHSLSPAMHNTAFEKTGFNGVYLAFQIKDVQAALSGMRSMGIRGFSVTIPHKISVMAQIDAIDEMARNIGAVNTIVNDNGTLRGSNTDCLGAINALKEKTPIVDKKVVLIGAGGAARAIAYGIKAEKGDLTIVNILEEEGRTLSKELSVPYFHLSSFSSLDYDILINATPVGMSPDTDAMPIPLENLKEDRVVMDIVYNPIQTKLLKEAAQKGNQIVDGVAMFVYQGVAQFELWTGLDAPVNLMREVVLKALGK